MAKPHAQHIFFSPDASVVSGNDFDIADQLEGPLDTRASINALVDAILHKGVKTTGGGVSVGTRGDISIDGQVASASDVTGPHAGIVDDQTVAFGQGVNTVDAVELLVELRGQVERATV